MLAAATSATIDSTAIVLAVLVVGLVGLLVARRNVRHTTLTATWWWCFTALLSTAGAELLAATGLLADEATGAAARYAARALLLCPVVSLVGAKRPQDGPWNFVVISLWGILALPAAEALLLNRGQPLEIQGFRSWFIVVLLLLTLANTLPTRHALAALCVVAGQTLLLLEYLPGAVSVANGSLGPWVASLGLALLAAAAVVFALQPPRAAAAHSLDHLWLDFRDTFGSLWSLRVQERLLATAKLGDWSVVPTWTGWVHTDGTPFRGELTTEQQKGIMVTYRGLLRRFVSNAWINARLPAPEREESGVSSARPI